MTRFGRGRRDATERGRPTRAPSAGRRETLLIGVPVLTVAAYVVVWLALRYGAAGVVGSTMRLRLALFGAVVIAVLGVRGVLRSPGAAKPRPGRARGTGVAGVRATTTPVATALRPLQRRHWQVLSHRYIPRRGIALGDIAIGPAGVYHITSYRWDGTTRARLARDGRLVLGHGEVTHLVHAALHQADAVANAMAAELGRSCLVLPVVAVEGAAAPRRPLEAAGATVISLGQLTRWLAAQPTSYLTEDPTHLAWVADRALPPNPAAVTP